MQRAIGPIKARNNKYLPRWRRDEFWPLKVPRPLKPSTNSTNEINIWFPNILFHFTKLQCRNNHRRSESTPGPMRPLQAVPAARHALMRSLPRGTQKGPFQHTASAAGSSTPEHNSHIPLPQNPLRRLAARQAGQHVARITHNWTGRLLHFQKLQREAGACETACCTVCSSGC